MLFRSSKDSLPITIEKETNNIMKKSEINIEGFPSSFSEVSKKFDNIEPQPNIYAYYRQTEDFEENMKKKFKNLQVKPSIPLNHLEHNHVHSEICGHIMIMHRNHVDFLHDGELHYIGPTGEVYPHKLEITEENPTGCHPIHSLNEVHSANHSLHEKLVTPYSYVNAGESIGNNE